MHTQEYYTIHNRKLRKYTLPEAVLHKLVPGIWREFLSTSQDHFTGENASETCSGCGGSLHPTSYVLVPRLNSLEVVASVQTTSPCRWSTATCSSESRKPRPAASRACLPSKFVTQEHLWTRRVQSEPQH